MSERIVEVPSQKNAGMPGSAGSRSHIGQDHPLMLCFQRKSILMKLMKHMGLVGRQGKSFSFEGCESLLDTFLGALTIYMETALKEIIERCEHRSGYHLHDDNRCELIYDMKTKMERLDERYREEHCLSDEDDNFQRKAPSSDFGLGIARRLTTTNNTALNAIGSRNRQAPLAAKPGGSLAMRPAAKLRWKYICVADVIRFLNDDKRYAQTRMLIAANSNYEH
ncbi:uncharacterized protein LOC111079112 [Drosophila obscura]|uniref:uncharacterized protein LOC111079112 n=1 Tax=Drosophila obscura TaxID=7282 RepID=UPI000BA04748|nr:uncharacterized protein LOC111079112 [Drosophila obscura]